MPKISVIIPMYNRKHYIEQCINSALNQTFDDYEIIVRDDGSTDGSADFVAEKYAAAISAGKIKLRRNDKNLGEFPTVNKLIHEATGKYIMILHSDDLYIPQALEYMYAVAENFNADVVHASRLFVSPRNSLEAESEEKIPLALACWENNPVDEVTVMPDDIESRVNEFINGGTFLDIPHKILRREFLVENDLRIDSYWSSGFILLFLMKAKVFVKTPAPFYIYRISPDSLTNMEFSPERVAKFISRQIKASRQLDEFFASEKFFRDKPELQYRLQSKWFQGEMNYWLERRGAYKDGITPELHRAVEDAFRKYFGDDAAYPIFLFHWINASIIGKDPNIITPPESLTTA